MDVFGPHPLLLYFLNGVVTLFIQVFDPVAVHALIFIPLTFEFLLALLITFLLRDFVLVIVDLIWFILCLKCAFVLLNVRYIGGAPSFPFHFIYSFVKRLQV